MPTYKYEASLPNGVAVFGIHDAADHADLVGYLQRRQLELVNSQELSLSANLTHDCHELPRMVQLRIGERLREAVMSGLPTHDAIRAIAAEPFEHPMLMLMPWMLILACFCSVVMLGLAVMVPEIRLYCMLIAMVLPVGCATAWSVASSMLIIRPRRALFRIADQIEKGQTADLKAFETMSGEMGAVARSELDERSKATSLADLVPSSTASHLRSHQMAARILGPIIVCCILFFGMHFVCLSVIPQMREMFLGFGVQLPAITRFTFWVSSFFEFFGYAGLFTMIALFGGGLAVLYLCLISARWMETISSIPWLGMSARWLLQARMARMLSVLLRNNADPAMAIQVAADSSESRTARSEGLKLARLIREGSSETAYSQLLSGLPLSMLFHISDSTANEGDRQQASQSFSLYADALERAASGNGMLFGLIVELAAVTLSALLIGFVVISFFAPLIQLMNDLA